MPDQDIDLAKFNDGDYNNALKARQNALEITQVCSVHAAQDLRVEGAGCRVQGAGQTVSQSRSRATRFVGFVRSDFLTFLDRICTTQGPKINCLMQVDFW
jgi:hypothetical protein